MLLAPPPPPYAVRPAAVAVVATLPGTPEAPAGYPTPWAVAPAAQAAGQWSRHMTTGDWHWWAGGRCTAVLRADGTCVRADAGGNPTAERCPRPDAGANPAESNYGIELPKMTGENRYWLSEAEVSREAAAETCESELRDDLGRWNLTVVDTTYGGLATAVEALPAATRFRLHVQYYAPGQWEVEQFGLTPKVTVRRAATGRGGRRAPVARPVRRRRVRRLGRCHPGRPPATPRAVPPAVRPGRAGLAGRRRRRPAGRHPAHQGVQVIAFLYQHPVLVFLLALARVVYFRSAVARVVVGAVVAAARDALAGRRATPAAGHTPPPAAVAYQAERPVPLVPLYRETPTPMAQAPTEDLSDATIQMRAELERRRTLARDRADALGRLLPPEPPAKPAPVVGA